MSINHISLLFSLSSTTKTEMNKKKTLSNTVDLLLYFFHFFINIYNPLDTSLILSNFLFKKNCQQIWCQTNLAPLNGSAQLILITKITTKNHCVRKFQVCQLGWKELKPSFGLWATDCLYHHHGRVFFAAVPTCKLGTKDSLTDPGGQTGLGIPGKICTSLIAFLNL